MAQHEAGMPQISPEPGVTTRRTALVLGATGRLGERVLDQALGQAVYERVYAWAKAPVSASLLKMVTVPCPDSLAADDVYCIVSEADAQCDRTEAFYSVSQHEVLALAKQVHEAGARRFVMVAPVSALIRPSALYQQLHNTAELELAAVGFESLVIVRPSLWHLRSQQGPWLARLLHATLQQIVGGMAGQRHAPVTSQAVAQAVLVHALRAAHGVTIIESDQLTRTIDTQTDPLAVGRQGES